MSNPPLSFYPVDAIALLNPPEFKLPDHPIFPMISSILPDIATMRVLGAIA
ncbi:MAG: hypothetical protein RIE73_33270 [Coleofasciculus sp. C1-SOL-03]|uniref:hypothetical protein n=1 Tax=Coleofasciculus sp. C1-SOL-03 TaxID=3069522 RepID=UPI0032F4E421